MLGKNWWRCFKMSNNIKICTICGRAIYGTDPVISAKPRKGKTVYAHRKCVYGGDRIGQKKESC